MEKEHIKRAGIMGGTFDPIHIGHLIAAERAREEFGLDCVFFIPAGKPPHKSYKEMASSTDRLNMVKVAVEDNSNFRLLDIEISREGSSYTIDTIKQVKEMFEIDDLYFIVGADNAREILKWRSAEELIKLVKFLVIARPGEWDENFIYDITNLRDNGGYIEILEVSPIPIASTNIRHRVKSNKSIKYMVTKDVEDYIYNNGLYK